MLQSLPFTKMQGVGNDFVVIDGRPYGGVDWASLAPQLCDRKFGVGADGLLVLDEAQQADVLMRMYNPDGTPDVCGNGLRCIARYAVERGIVGGEELTIATLAGVRRAQVARGLLGPHRAEVVAISVGMGEPEFEPAVIPMRVAQSRVVDYPLPLADGIVLPITALSTGSTHSIAFVEEPPDDAKFFALSPQVENHALFPERTSLMWCKIEPPLLEEEGIALSLISRLQLRIWERGAGETWGCGTGACASAVAAILHGYVPPDAPVLVASKGGELLIHWQEGGPITMTGPAEFVFDGIYPLPASSTD